MSVASSSTENGRYCTEIKTCCNKSKATYGQRSAFFASWHPGGACRWLFYEKRLSSLLHASLTRLSRVPRSRQVSLRSGRFFASFATRARSTDIDNVAHYTVYVGTIRSTLEIGSHYLLTDRWLFAVPADNTSICPKFVNDRTIGSGGQSHANDSTIASAFIPIRAVRYYNFYRYLYIIYVTHTHGIVLCLLEKQL